MLRKLFKKNHKKRSEPRFPDFVCIGAQKAGTTWLYEMLRIHPDVAFAQNSEGVELKEVHYWDLRQDRGLEWYQSLYQTTAKFCGDITPAYSILSSHKITEFHSALPGVKLVLIIRNPIDRAWSLALMNLQHESVDFDAASDEWFINQFNDPGSLARGDYPKILSEWQRLYSDDQLLILNYDDLVTDPKAIIIQVAEHIGLDGNFYLSYPDEYFKQRVFSGSGKQLKPELHKILLDIYSDKIKHTGRLLKWDTSAWINDSKGHQPCSSLSPIKERRVSKTLDSSSLVNSGVVVLGDPTVLSQSFKTIIVVGIARGGTSMVAGTLAHLGVFAGERAGAPVFEDVELSDAFEGQCFDKVSEVITRYNQNHATWLFKRPSSIEYLDEIHKRVRNPVYLFIFKDILSVSNRNQISMRQEVLKGLDKAHADYAKILKFIRNVDNVTGIMLSYEKALLDKKSFVDGLVELLFSERISESKKRRALKFIEPSPEHYLDQSRSSKVVGKLETIDQKKVVGWAKKTFGKQKALIKLVVNGQPVAECLADKALDCLDENHAGFGFEFNLNECPLLAGDRVEVRAQDEVQDLNGSPVTFAGYLPVDDDTRSKSQVSSAKPWLFTDVSGLLFNDVTDWFAGKLGESELLVDCGVHSHETSSVIKTSYRTDDLYGFWQSKGVEDGFRVLAVDSSLLRYSGFFPTAKIMTFVCSSIRFVAKEYDYHVRYKRYTGSLREFVSKPQFQNMQSKRLGAVPVQLLGLVGVVERLEDSLALMEHELNFDNSGLKAFGLTNTNEDDLTVSLSEEERLLIASVNKKDEELYQKALLLLKNRTSLGANSNPYVFGMIQSLDQSRVVGCAFLADATEPVHVEIWLNGVLVKTVSAAERRPGLIVHGVARAGFVGFSYRFPKPLAELTEVECRVAGTGQVLI